MFVRCKKCLSRVFLFLFSFGWNCIFYFFWCCTRTVCTVQYVEVFFIISGSGSCVMFFMWLMKKRFVFWNSVEFSCSGIKFWCLIRFV